MNAELEVVEVETSTEHESYVVNEPLDLLVTSVTAQGSLICIVGRDSAGERYTVQVPYSPYFYVPDEEADDPKWPASVMKTPGFRSVLDDRPLTRITVSTPAEVPRRRRNHKHFEADVPYPRRFLIDTGIRRGVRISRYTVLGGEDKRGLLAEVGDLLPFEVDAPMFGILYDIETRKNPKTGKWDQKPPTAKNVNGAITAITWNWCRWDKDGAHPSEKVTTFQWQERGERHGRVTREQRMKYSHALDKQVAWEIVTFSSEADMLVHFTAEVKLNPPDVMAAWNGHYGFKVRRKPGGTGGFDAPFVINRLDEVGIGSNQLSPFNHAFAGFGKRGHDSKEFFWKCEIAGIQLVDMMTTYTIKDGGMTGSVPFAGLKDVVESKTKMPIVKDPAAIDEWWMYHNDAFLDYCFQDVDALMLLERTEEYVLYIKRFQWMAGAEDADCLFKPSTLIDCLWLRKAKELGVILPSGGDDEAMLEIDEDERGGHVYSRPGRRSLFKNVVAHDFSALYAAILESGNIGRDTLVLDAAQFRDDDIVVPIKDDWSVTARFRSPFVKKGIVPQSLVELRAARKVYDDQIAVAKSPAEVKRLKKEREPAKQLLLASWGVLKNAYSRLGHVHAGAAIPAMGRFLIKTAIKASEELLEEPIFYTDTDGALTPTPEHMEPVEFGFWLEKQFASAVDQAARKMNIKQHNFEMGFERVDARFVMGRTKKKYAALTIWSEGTPAPPHGGPACMGFDAKGKPKCVHFNMTGFEAVKHDTAPITKELETRLLWSILHDVPTDKLVSYVRTTYDNVKNGEVDVREIVKAQRLGFDLDRDADKNTDIVRGARNARDLFGFDFVVGARVLTLRTKGTVDVVSVPEDGDIPVDELKVDWAHHADATVLKPVKLIFEMVGEDPKTIFESIEKRTQATRQQKLQFS